MLGLIVKAALGSQPFGDEGVPSESRRFLEPGAHEQNESLARYATLRAFVHENEEGIERLRQATKRCRLCSIVVEVSKSRVFACCVVSSQLDDVVPRWNIARLLILPRWNWLRLAVTVSFSLLAGTSLRSVPSILIGRVSTNGWPSDPLARRSAINRTLYCRCCSCPPDIASLRSR